MRRRKKERVKVGVLLKHKTRENTTRTEIKEFSKKAKGKERERRRIKEPKCLRQVQLFAAVNTSV